MITGFLPPISRFIFFKFFDASIPISLPVSVPPVNEIALIYLFLTISLPIDDPSP